jgi:ligand-binding sensor domain-containing protein/two-component sensor histidine kinase
MNILKKAFLIILFLVSFVLTKAQTPSYYMLGEEELSGIKLYDLIQDKEHNYWIATDQGLIKYDGYSFEQINIEKSLSNSIFDLRSNHKGQLFFKNYSGQIFAINNDSCSLYFQIPDSLMSNEIYFEFNNHNELVIASSHLFKVDNNKNITFLHNSKKRSIFGEPNRLKDSTMLINNINSNELIELKNGQYKSTKIEKNTLEYIIQSFYLNDQLRYYSRSTKNFLIKEGNKFYKDQKNHLINENKSARYYSDNENLFIVTYSGGVRCFDKNLVPLYQNKTLFKNNFISFEYKDDKGNILLGTFDDGIIVIPNIHLMDINIDNEKTTKITSTPDNILFSGTQSGKIYRTDSLNNTSLFWNKPFKNIEVLHFFEETNELLFDHKESTLINIDSKQESYINTKTIKSISKISDNNYIIAANYELSRFYPLEKKLNSILNLGKRTYNIVYNPITNSTYAGTTTGLKITKDKDINTFLLNNEAITVRDIVYNQETILVTTRKNGILLFKNDQLFNQWNKSKGFPTNNVNKIKIHQNKYYISSDLGLIITDSTGLVFTIINKSSGLHSSKIIDFELQNNFLWIVTQKGVQRLNMDAIQPFNFTPSIAINELLVNDSSISINTNQLFNFNQNKFEFVIGTNNIKYKNEITYHYQLVDIDKKWQTNNYSSNKIKYKSLPPGSYVFQVKSKCRNNESEIISYHFKIAEPYWNTWWFYVLCLLTFIIIVYLIFNREIKKQRKKIQLESELNTSKLIAIKSQMNPHFIFNAINSIQDLILKGDIDNSYSYIIKFSKLVRQTLSFSDKEFIDLEAEIELLKVYLELEKLRFKDDFKYSITCDLEDLQVPPMLIQPFVENAIKHGLLHKEGSKTIDVLFKKDDTLTCTVTDNGIGRNKAQEIKERQQKNHQSFSVNATKSRFTIMQSHYQQSLGVSFKDLNSTEENTGTIVTIKMPFKQKY